MNEELTHIDRRAELFTTMVHHFQTWDTRTLALWVLI